MELTDKWTEQKNARRAALINKKHDRGLSTAQKKELARLQKEADEYVDRVAPSHSEKLEQLLTDLKQKAKLRKRFWRLGIQA
jgi:hypothetical protein